MYIQKDDLTIRKMVDLQEKDPVTMLFKDYKNVSGKYPMPYLIEMFNKEKLFSTIKMNSVEINCEIDDAIFKGDDVKNSGGMNDLMKQFIKPE